MIHIVDKSACCGCNACVQRCPKHCITMREDEEGFLYPFVDQSLCIDCGLCERVCPVLRQGEARKPLKVYAAKNLNEEVRMSSSSGGVFTALAERVLDEGGVVFGVRFDENWDVVHDYVDNKKDLVAFRGSKYVQSNVGTCFQKAESFLKEGRRVLFSGTPCQIAGLRLFLKKEYDNLLTVDLVCHGVPSPKVWRTYLEETIARQCEKNSVFSHSTVKRKSLIKGISFRDKRLGWKKYSFSLTLSTTEGSGAKNTVFLSDVLTKNIFLQGFLHDLYLRPSCHACPSKCFKSGSDLTIADYWGIGRYYKDFDDDRGVSLLIVNTSKGENFQSELLINAFETSYEEALSGNRSMKHSAAIPRYRNEFWKLFHRDGTVAIENICKKMRPGMFRKGISLGKRIVKKCMRIVIREEF